MGKTIETLIKKLGKFQEALTWEIDNRNAGLLTVNLDSENQLQWAKYDSDFNIQDIYFVRVYFEHRIEVQKTQIYDRYLLTIKIIDKEPFSIFVHIDIDEEKQSSPNLSYIGGNISIQVFNEEKNTFLPLIFYVENDELVKDLKEEVKFFMDYSGVEDEGLIHISNIIDMLILLLKNKNISFNIFD